MAEVIYETKAQCLKAIETVKALGAEPAPWMLQQLAAFEAKEAETANIKNSETPIWDTLKAHYPYGTMPQEKIDCVESTVEKLLEEGDDAEAPGLLLGKIQCGKTDTFEDIIGLSFDKGIDIAIVLTKGTKPLAEQTRMRAKRDYRYFKSSDDLGQKSTIVIYDILDIWRGLRQATVESSKVFIVCKKETTNLDHLIDLFKKNSTFLKKKKVLIVDDEADFASRNYKMVKQQALTDENGLPIAQDAEIEMAKISQQIDDFRKIPEFCRYLQVTATPYCLYLQPQGDLNLNGQWIKPFKPRFTSLVPIHEAYVGGKEYFEDSKNPDSMYSHLYHQVEKKCMDVLLHEDKRYLNNTVASGNIYGLTYSLISYFMATAIRRIQVRETKNKDYKTSFIIHVGLDKKNHEWQYKVVMRLIESIKKAVLDDDQSDQRIWSAIDVNYDDFVMSNQKGKDEGLVSIDMPSKDDVMKEIRAIFDPSKNNYHVQIVNSDEQVANLLDEETGELRLETAATIFIGGSILDRGITVKNLLSFFYGRNPNSFQQDTVLQHARMFGARSKEDMAVTRLHTTAIIHKILVRINDLDNQLREWFLAGKDQNEQNATFLGFDKDIKPCAAQKIKPSNAITIKKQTRMLPVGFWTGTKKEINKTTEKIDSLIENSANYRNQDENGFFEMDKETVVNILKLIESTYVYDKKYFNDDRKNDIKEMLCALVYCTYKSSDKIYALHRTNRNMSRIRENGGYIDAPDDGRTDTQPSRAKAIDAPVVMFIRQNGEKTIRNGENIGWNQAPFYWPVLMTQENIEPVMFAIDQGKKGKVAVVEGSDILDGIDPKEVLRLTFKGDLEQAFGKEGDVVEQQESRSLKETTASKYLQKDENGNWAKNPDVPFDEAHDHGIYSYNNGEFPFLLKPYKYMLLRNRHDAKADLILLELTDMDKWEIIADGKINEKGDLIDHDTQKVLMHCTDTIMDKDMNKTVHIDKTVTQWIIVFSIKKVLKFRKNAIDWDKVFGEENEDE